MAKSQRDRATDASPHDAADAEASSSSSTSETDVAEPTDQDAASEDSAAEAAEVLEPIVEDAEDNAADEAEAVAKAQAETAEWQDKYMRLHAEWDTYRRRTKEQREEEKARATEKLVTSLIPVIDDFERTIDYATENGESGLLDGVEAVHAKLMSTLEKDGVETIDPAGEAFDALEAQAVGTDEDTSVPDETVSQVYQKGYRMGAKVLRPAMVTVTTGGPKREKPEDEEE